MKWLKLIRIHHYIKNVLVFFPLFFNGSIFNIQLLITSFMGFLVFLSAGVVRRGWIWIGGRRRGRFRRFDRRCRGLKLCHIDFLLCAW